jgi:hypothetical protein
MANSERVFSGSISIADGATGGSAGMFSKPYTRATSSIRSSSISMSKRYDGAVTWNRPSSRVNGSCRRVKMSATMSSVTGTPMTFAARAVRSVTGLRCGRFGAWSSIGPTLVSAVPQISTISDVMRSMCSTVVA